MFNVSLVCRLNDDLVGYGDLDTKVINTQPTPEEATDTDRVYEFFLKLAGEDKEVDWKELKQILDYSMRSELQQSTKGGVQKTNISGVNAAPMEANIPQQTNTDNNLITTLISLICGALCKDTPLAEFIPAPAANTPLSASFAELGVQGFSKDICRSMVAMLDQDRSGKLGYDEFKSLWTSLRNWKNAWSLYDKDNSGALSGFELRQALNSAGYRLNNRVLNVIMHRYGNKNGEIQFDDFMLCAIKLKTMMDIFKLKDKNDSNTATFNIEDWLENTLYS